MTMVHVKQYTRKVKESYRPIHYSHMLTDSPFPGFEKQLRDSPFELYTDLPDFDESLIHYDEDRKYNFKLEWKSPEAALQEQYEQRPSGARNGEDPSFETWLLMSSSNPKTYSYARQMKEEPTKLFPVIVTEYSSTGERIKFQEGRTRALAAKIAGLKSIPVLRATHRR